MTLSSPATRTMFWNLQENALTSADIEALVAFVRSNERFTQGPRVRDFEAAYSKWQGCSYSVMVNSGSAANLLLMGAVKELRNWRDGDEVIVPALTWPTTITPVMQCGLKPVFVDANLTDLSFDYDQLARKITPRTRGIFVAHLLGFPGECGQAAGADPRPRTSRCWRIAANRRARNGTESRSATSASPARSACIGDTT